MIKFLPAKSLVCAAILSFSAYSLQAQTATNSKYYSDISATDELSAAPADGSTPVGKEIPVAGGVLFVTPAERANRQKEMSAKEAVSNKEKRRQRRLKKQDRKEVADVIGNSVNTYLANATTVHTLQRF